MDDIRAVMDAVGSKKAVLFGHSEGGSVSALFAATYPNRTISLIAYGIFAKRRYAPDYPWAPTDKERQEVYDMIENSWGSGDMNLESLAPSKVDDRRFMEWLANYFRSGASPSAAMVLTKMNTEVDIIDILGSIKVPTLLMQRTHDIDVKIDEGRFIADRILNAKFVEFEGADHLFWAGNTQEVIDEMKAFILKVEPRKIYREQLFTVVAANIIGSEAIPAEARELIESLIVQYRGSIVQYVPTRFIATFEGPSKAVHCSIELVDAIRKVEAKLSVGVHIREGAVDQAHFISDDTETFVEVMLRQALPNQILITQTVRNLLSGAGLSFLQDKSVFETSSGASYQLFSVTDQSMSLPEEPGEVSLGKLPQNDSFLENVLQSIDDHLNNEAFGVEMLCREVGISERQLQRKLKAVTNKSPNQLITSVRLHRAKELLTKRNYTVAEVAFQTGFTSPSYFSKCFKREFRKSPSDLMGIVK